LRVQGQGEIIEKIRERWQKLPPAAKGFIIVAGACVLIWAYTRLRWR